MARMLQVFGISLPGDLVGPAPDNEKGFFEDKAIVALNDEVMGVLGLRWDSLDGFFLGPEDFSAPQFDPLKETARALVQQRAGEADWAFKDPRFSRLTGFWLPILAAENINCKVIIAVRSPAAVAASLGQRNGFADLKSFYLWLLYTLDVLLATQQLDRIIVSYDALMSAPEKTLATLAGFFGPVVDTEQEAFISEFVDRDLNHHQEASPGGLLASADLLYRSLVDASGRSDHQDLMRLIPDQSTQSLLALIEHQQSLQVLSENRLNDIVRQKDADIAAFQSYQTKLQNELEEQTAWGTKLSADVDQLQQGAQKLGRDITDLKTGIADRDSRIDQLNDHVKAARDEAGELAASLSLAEKELAAESSRLWEIIEMYRSQVTLMEGSLSWRLTAPLRWTMRMLRRLPSLIFGLIRQCGRFLIHLLPADSMLRQRIIKIYERTKLLLAGEVDNDSVRASHQELIAQRQAPPWPVSTLAGQQLPMLDISIVTYNSQRWIAGFVESLTAQRYPIDRLRLVFVDNGSSDETVSALNAVDWSGFADFKLVENDNAGFGGGHNVGVSMGDSDLVLVTNVDIEFTPDCLVRAVNFALVDDVEVASWELRQAPFEHPKFYDPVSFLTGWSAHACVLFRRSAFESAGGYEPRIFMYGEDVELSYRFRSLGFKLRYLPFALVNHYTYETPGEVKRLQYQGSTLANAYIRLRYGSVVDMLRILPLYARLALSDSLIEGQKKIVRGNISKILKNATYFYRRRQADRLYSFRDWDYDIVRDGAFHETRHLGDELPLVSVITRTYAGREKLLHECLRSVSNQTYPNIEHVIVEDGGNAMQETVLKFQNSEVAPSIQYFPLPKGGRCVAGNEGLARAQGKYLVFLDDDDLFFADHIEVCVSELLADEEISGAYAMAWEVETEFDDSAADINYHEMSHGTPAGHQQPFDRDVLLEHNFIPIQSLVFDRNLFEQHGGFDPELDNLEDWNLWVRYTSDASFKMIPKTTSMYRTPWDLAEKSRRQAVLDDYLEVAKEKNRQAQLSDELASGRGSGGSTQLADAID